MMNASVLSLLALLAPLTLNGCCRDGVRVALPPRPPLEPFSVRNCRIINDVEWCDVTIKPVLLNNEALQNHVYKLENEATCWKP